MGETAGYLSEARRLAFRHGALLIGLDDPAFAAVASLRERCDPGMAALVGPHITLTPPFLALPDRGTLRNLRPIVARRLPFMLTVGEVSRFAGTDIVFLRARPVETLRALRADLLATGLFAPDPYPDGEWVPHMTISETSTGADLAERAAASIAAVETVCRSIIWANPDERRFVARVVLG